MQELVGSSRNRIMEASEAVLCSGQRTMEDLATYNRFRPIVLPDTYRRACVIEGDEVLTFRREERETQKLFVDTSKIPAATWSFRCWKKTDWVVLVMPCTKQQDCGNGSRSSERQTDRK